MTKMEEEFNYSEALRRLEEIAVKVEDPATGIEDVDKYLAESAGLISRCREYLRSVKDSL